MTKVIGHNMYNRQPIILNCVVTFCDSCRLSEKIIELESAVATSEEERQKVGQFLMSC